MRLTQKLEKLAVFVQALDRIVSSGQNKGRPKSIKRGILIVDDSPLVKTGKKMKKRYVLGYVLVSTSYADKEQERNNFHVPNEKFWHPSFRGFSDLHPACEPAPTILNKANIYSILPDFRIASESCMIQQNVWVVVNVRKLATL